MPSLGRPQPRLGSERENWRRAGFKACDLGAYLSMGLALAAAYAGLLWLGGILCVVVFACTIGAVVLGGE